MEKTWLSSNDGAVRKANNPASMSSESPRVRDPRNGGCRADVLCVRLDGGYPRSPKTRWQWPPCSLPDIPQIGADQLSEHDEMEVALGVVFLLQLGGADV